MKKLLKEFSEHWQLFVLVIPALIYLIIFCYIPIAGIVIAFKEYDPVLRFFRIYPLETGV